MSETTDRVDPALAAGNRRHLAGYRATHFLWEVREKVDAARERTIADAVRPSEYGRREAFTVHRALREKGPVKVPREFVFMDRAAIGLGGVFLHLGAKLNYYRLFNEAIERFSIARVGERQRAALAKVGL